MLSSVPKSERAVQVNIPIIRAFVRMHELPATHKALAAKMEKLEGNQRENAVAVELLASDLQILGKSDFIWAKRSSDVRR